MGYLDGVDDVLDRDALQMFYGAIAKQSKIAKYLFEAGQKEFIVKEAARWVLSAFNSDERAIPNVRVRFFSNLRSLLRRNPLINCPCHRHNDCRAQLWEKEGSLHFDKLMDSAVDAEILLQHLPLGPPRSGRLFSRLMPLRRFYNQHVLGSLDQYNPGYVDGDQDPRLGEWARNLAPSQSRLWRLAFLRPDSLYYSIGHNLNPAGVEVERGKPCYLDDVFTTLAEALERIFGKGRREIDRCLQLLGVPYEPGAYWIELIYPEEAIEPIKVTENQVFRVAIASVFEAKGRWVFWPKRSGPPNDHGLTRDLASEEVGLPEFVHQPFAPTKLYDAIVWEQRTLRVWCQSSPWVRELR